MHDISLATVMTHHISHPSPLIITYHDTYDSLEHLSLVKTVTALITTVRLYE